MAAQKGGLPEAQYNLGLMYTCGDGVEKDLAKGIEWMRIAGGEGGYAGAQNYLGLFYEKGIGVKRNA